MKINKQLSKYSKYSLPTFEILLDRLADRPGDLSFWKIKLETLIKNIAIVFTVEKREHGTGRRLNVSILFWLIDTQIAYI